MKWLFQVTDTPYGLQLKFTSVMSTQAEIALMLSLVGPKI